MIQMIANRYFPYAGRRLSPGDTFEVVGRSDARLLAAIGHAKVDKNEPTLVPLSSSDAEAEDEIPEPKQKRAYKRRDMAAE